MCYLFALSITKRGVSKSVTVTVGLPTCPSISDSFCFMYFEGLWICAFTFRITAFLVNWLFKKISDNFLIQKPTWSGIFCHTILDSMATVVNRKRLIVPNSQRCPCPNPQNLWACYLAGQGDFVNVTKLSSLRWEHYTDYLDESNVFTGFFVEGDHRAGVMVGEVRMESRGCSGWRKGLGTICCRQPLEAEKARAQILTAELPKQASLLTPRC